MSGKLILIKNAHLFSPQDLGKKDVLVVGNQIAQIGENLSTALPEFTQVIDAQGQMLCPGLVDSLTHIIGGGGEGGFATRTAEMQIDDAIEAGVTTVTGVLGTDSITRTQSQLLAKARQLQAGGIHVVCHTGSYHLPPVTLCQSVQEDLTFIPEYIGVGEVAIADHRCAEPSVAELAKVCADARVGGMLGGKAGIVSIHLGDGKTGLQKLLDVAEQTDLPLTQFYPTHVNRNQRLLTQAIDYAKQGGYLDFTASTTEAILAAGETRASAALKQLLDAGVPLQQMTFSSDGFASLPLFENGQLIDLQSCSLTSLWEEVWRAVDEQQIAFADALSCVTLNPANILGLKSKGRIELGCDADLVLLDEQRSVQWVMASGTILKQS